MKGKFLRVFCVLVVMMGVFQPVGAQSVLGQAPEPPQDGQRFRQPCLPGEPCQDEDGNWYMPKDERPHADIQNDVKSIGGPDDFGYTWDDGVTYSWVDATNGTDTGLDQYNSQTDPISLPFTFPYYENSYSQLYIATFGYLTFNDDWTRSQSEIPDSDEPNNVIAPFWAPNDPIPPSGKVYYKSGGTAPNRYFVVEWHQLTGDEGGVFTFETILYENGNIKFQYKTIENPYWCWGIGIEDSKGLDGLAYTDFCRNYPTANTAVLFTRPVPSARVGITTLYLGEFTKPGGINEFKFTVINTGELGSDTYDFSASSSWSTTLHNASNEVALTDTDGDSLVDTGPLAQGASFEVLVEVVAPGGLSAGAENKAYVTAISTLNTSKSKTVTLESTIPAPFAQTYFGLQPGMVNLDLNWPNLQTTVDITPTWSNGYSPAVVETPDHHFVNVWSNLAEEEDAYGYFLQYSLVDRFGKIIKPVTDLTEIYSVEGFSSYDYDPAIAVTADGRIGITWYKVVINQSNQVNYNIWFAILSPAGDLAYGPVNLTDNSVWGRYGDEGFTQLSSPTIASTEDNRFMVTWDSRIEAIDGTLAEVFYTILQSNGASIVTPTKIADGIAGYLEYYNATITSLAGNRFIMTYSVFRGSQIGTLNCPFRVYDSSGAILKTETETGLFCNGMVPVQLSGGNILIASGNWNDSIQYTIFNGSNYNHIFTSSELTHPSTTGWLKNLSITKDNANRAILTWGCENEKYLYYALIDSGGAVLSGPSIFHSVQEDGYIYLSYTGYGNTTNSWTPATDVEGIVSFTSNVFGAAPGGQMGIGISYANEGFSTATNPILTLTLGAGLTYTGDSSGIIPSVVGNTITWHLPDLAFGDHDQFIVFATIPDAAPIGTLYSLGLMLVSDGLETDPSNNTATAHVMSAEQVFLPALIR